MTGWQVALWALLGAIAGGVVGYFVGYGVGSWVLRDCSEMDCLAVGLYILGFALAGAVAGGIAAPRLARRMGAR